MSTSGSLPNRSSDAAARAKPAVLYSERFHLKYLFVSSGFPMILLTISLFFAWLFNKGVAFSQALNTSPPSTPEHVEGGVVAEMLTAIVQAIMLTLQKAFGALLGLIPQVDLGWTIGLQLLWWLFVGWAIARSWFRWFKSRVEVTMEGFTIYTPKSLVFALGTKGNRTVPVRMVFDADEASSIIDNTLFLKTVSRVNVFVMDTAGNDDSVSVKYARRAKALIKAIKYISQFNAPQLHPTQK